MDKVDIQTVAAQLLGLSLTPDEAGELAGPLEGLRQMVELIDRVPLPYSAQPFITPHTGDRWLEAWRDPESPQAPPRGGAEGKRS